MANTSDLKKIESHIREKFLNEIGAQLISAKIPGFDPDIIAIKGDTLILGEISVSGFSGGKKGAAGFHTGAARKISDCYAKLDILRRKKDFIVNHLKIPISEIEIFYVTVKGSKYKAGGWRKELFDVCDFIPKEITVNEETMLLILDSITSSKNEMQIG